MIDGAFPLEVRTAVSWADEEWRDVPGFPCRTSNFGRIMVPGGFKVQRPSQGYPCVILYIDRKPRKVAVHRLVALAWKDPPPTEQHQVRHLDGTRFNNVPENLEWGTVAENAEDRRRHGRNRGGRRRRGL